MDQGCLNTGAWAVLSTLEKLRDLYDKRQDLRETCTTPAAAAADDSAICPKCLFRQINPTQYVKTKSQQLFRIKTCSTYAAGIRIVE